jgi:hypothetical protein
MTLIEKLHSSHPGQDWLSRKEVKFLLTIYAPDVILERWGGKINFNIYDPPGINYEAKQKKKEAKEMKITATNTYPYDVWLNAAFPPIVAHYTDDSVVSYEPISLDPFNWDPVPTPQKEQPGENPMYFHFNTASPIENQQIDFAFQYAKMAYHEAEKSLRVKHLIDEPDAPKDAEEFIERIKAGKYTLMDKETSKYFLEFTDSYDGDYTLPKRLRWRTEKADEAGYEAALEALDTAFTKLKATIMANDYKASIDAVDAFAAKHTVH